MPALGPTAEGHNKKKNTGRAGRDCLRRTKGGERLRPPEETFIKSMVGDDRGEHPFTLRQSLAAGRNPRKPIAECEWEIEGQLYGGKKVAAGKRQAKQPRGVSIANGRQCAARQRPACNPARRRKPKMSGGGVF
jgi:hypothetical protein